MFKKTRVTEYGRPDITGFNWCKEGLVFQVINGLGKLRKVSSDIHKDDNYYSQLQLNGVPIVQGYYPICPTCYGMLATGYGIENVKCDELNSVRSTLNQNYSGIEDAYFSLMPLLRLLSDGMYMLADVELAPTDGHHFFYNVPNEMTENSALCDQYYNADFLAVTDGFPAFMYPTQSSKSIDDKRVGEYREKLEQGTEIRGLAYYEKGFICALLDGHHKAIAAAQLGKKLKCLTIIPMTGCRREKSELPYEKRKVDTCFFAEVSIALKPARTNKDLFPKTKKREKLKIEHYELTDKRFASMEKAVAYHSIEHISSLDAAGIVDEETTEADIERWIRCADAEGGIMLKYLLEYRTVSDYDSAYHIAETIIKSDCRNLPYREAWRTLLQKKNSHTENIAIEYIVSHTAQDNCWDLVTSYWDS